MIARGGLALAEALPHIYRKEFAALTAEEKEPGRRTILGVHFLSSNGRGDPSCITFGVHVGRGGCQTHPCRREIGSIVRAPHCSTYHCHKRSQFVRLVGW